MKVEYEPIEDELVLDYYVPISIDYPENIHPRNLMRHYYRFINFNNEEWHTFIGHLQEAGRLQEKGG